jgi:filamentous hemagglutinin
MKRSKAFVLFLRLRYPMNTNISGNGTASDIKKAFNRTIAINSANSVYEDGALTKAGYAVTQHPECFDFESADELKEKYRTPQALNELGSSAIRTILAKGIQTTGAGGRYPKGWITYTLPEDVAADWGNGTCTLLGGTMASWEPDGTFIGL